MLRILCGVLLSGLASLATAETPTSGGEARVWEAGRHYELVDDSDRDRKKGASVEVVEWFWLGCPHCFAIEPYVLKWERTKSSDVTFSRFAVAWDKPERVAHAKLFFALKKIGRLDLQQSVFETIHRDRNRLYVPNGEGQTLHLLKIFAQSHGLDPAVFVNVYRSVEADAYVAEANEKALSMHVQGVPSISVNGRYTTDLVRAGGPERLFELVDYLVKKEQREREGKAERGSQ